MIEWVPIKDFKDIGGVLYLFLYKHKTKINKDPIVTSGIYTHSDRDRNLFVDYDMTHAALLNLPADKTLEEKFEDYYFNTSFGIESKAVRQGLAKVAKEHYEGKE